MVIGSVPVEFGQQIVQVGGGEPPLERLCRGAVAVSEGSEPVPDLARRLLRRGEFTSRQDLIDQTKEFTVAYDTTPVPSAGPTTEPTQSRMTLAGRPRSWTRWVVPRLLRSSGSVRPRGPRGRQAPAGRARWVWRGGQPRSRSCRERLPRLPEALRGGAAATFRSRQTFLLRTPDGLWVEGRVRGSPARACGPACGRAWQGSWFGRWGSGLGSGAVAVLADGAAGAFA
ncbi:hypothetical protein ABIA33_007660 [Streptacidiphilus sp. MAP12-16]